MTHQPTRPAPVAPGKKRGVLDWIELVGNKLLETAFLFVLLAGRSRPPRTASATAW